MAASLRPRRPLSRPHRGQTIVLFALGSLMLMAMLGLAIDAGYEYVQRRSMQNAADAAAQAGTKALHQKKTGDEIEAAALEAAAQNGHPGGAADFQYYFIYKTYQTTPTTSTTTCGATTVNDGSTYAGVQIQIKETHQTFVMRIIGITEAGTAAVSTAQVQILATLDMANAPFIVCGYQAKTKHGDTINLLTGTPAMTTGYSPDAAEGSITGTVKLDPNNAFQSGWDWSSGVRPPTPSDDDDYYILWGSNNFTLQKDVETDSGDNSLCNATGGFWGANGNPSDKYTLDATGFYAPPGDAGDVNLPVNYTSGSAPTGPKGQIQGPLGCPAGVMDRCILILPIADLADLPDAPAWASPAPSPKPIPNATALRVRAWGAFWVTHDTTGFQENYYGQLIKYYPMQGNGWNSWSRDIDFTGPVVVHLIR